MDRLPFSKSQHTYLKGKPAETTLREVSNTVERSLYSKEYTLGALSIMKGLNGICLMAYLMQWIVSILTV